MFYGAGASVLSQPVCSSTRGMTAVLRCGQNMNSTRLCLRGKSWQEINSFLRRVYLPYQMPFGLWLIPYLRNYEASPTFIQALPFHHPAPANTVDLLPRGTILAQIAKHDVPSFVLKSTARPIQNYP